MTKTIILALLVPLFAHAQLVMGGNLTMDGGLHVQGNPNISIVTQSLANGVVNVPYSQTVQTANGKGTISFSLAQGGLPVGLSLNTSTGAITGTPTTTGSYSFVIRADATGPPARFATQSYTVSINCAALIVNTTTLPGGISGTPYSFQMQSSGGVVPVTWTLSTGALPAGLSLSSGGVISGTPTTVQSTSPNIQAQDSCFPTPQSVSSAYTLGIVSPVVITTTSLPQAVEGLLYSTTLAAAGGVSPYTWALGSGTLPTGLSLSAAGVISGTPTTTVSTPFAIQVTDSSANVTTVTFSITVTCTPLSITTATLPTGIPGTPYSAQLVSSGGTGAVTWSIVSGLLPTGITLSSAGVLSGTPTQNGSFPIGFQVQDSCVPTPQATQQLLTLTILSSVTITTSSPLPNGIQGQPYSVQLSASGGTPPYTWSGGAPAGLAIGAGGVVSGTPTTSGVSTVTAQVQDSAGLNAFGNLQLTVTCPTVSITSVSPLPSATNGQSYNFQFTSTGGVPPLMWSGLSFPPGLGISVSGVFGGVPTANGTYTPTISVNDSCSPTSQRSSGLFSIQVVASVPPLTISNTSPLPGAIEGQPYSLQMQANGGVPPYTWSRTAGALPAGLTISSGGIISGTANTTGTSTATLRVTDANAQTASGPFSITVTCTALAMSSTSPLANGTQGTAYSQQLQSTGGTGSVTWAVTAGALPTGITLSSSGSLSGTPSVSGSFSATIAATDSCAPTPQSVSRSFSITISPLIPPLTISTTSPLPSGTQAVAYSGTMAANGGVPPYTWTVTGGSLPGGLTLSGAGTIAGTPTTVGTATATIQVADSASHTASGSFSITISCVPLVISSTSPLAPGTVSTAYSAQLQSQGGTGATTWSLASGSFPTGVSISAGGLISGTPSTSGTFTPTVQIADSCSTPQVTTKQFSLTIAAALAILTTSPLPSITLNQPYSTTLNAAGGTPPYTWSLTSGTLPAGLSLSAGGVISGTPTATGFKQVNATTAASGASSVIPFLSAQVAGDFNVVMVMWGDTTSSVTSVTDTRGNTYSVAVGPITGTGLRSVVYYAKNIAAGANTVTVTFNQTAAFPNVNVAEYSGVNTTTPLDVSAQAVGSGTLADSGSATTTTANSLLIGMGSPSTVFTGPGAGFTSRIINSFGGLSEDRIVSSVGSYNATGILTSGSWTMQMAAFKAVGGLGTSTFTIKVTDNVAANVSRVFTITSPAHTVTLSWTASVTGGVTYNVKRSTVTGGPYTVLATGISPLTYLDQTVQPATTYYYVVSAQSGATESSNSNQATAVVP